MSEDWLTPKPVVPLTGEERFKGIEDATVRDFWSWFASDLRDDTTRGILSEFIVAKAVGAEMIPRVSWANYDVLAPGDVREIRIQVKSSAYLQSWKQPHLSKIQFAGLVARSWDPEARFGEEQEVRADVFVFAVQTCTDPEKYDGLDVGQWSFWVTSAEVIRDCGFKSVGLSFVEKHATKAAFSELAAAVEAASRRNPPLPGSD